MRRHYHRDGRTLVVDGKIYFGIAESRNTFVCADGTFVTLFQAKGDYRGKPDRLGYRKLKIGNHEAKAHRVVFEVCANAVMPDVAEIDHINGKRGDNRFENLRVVYSRKENMANPLTRLKQAAHLKRIHNDKAVQDKKRMTWAKKTALVTGRPPVL